MTPAGSSSGRSTRRRSGSVGRATSRLAGGTPAENATIVESILRGEPGARRDVVLLNAGAALVVAGVVDDLAAGIDRAALTIDAGLATELLTRLRAERRGGRGAAGRGSNGVTLADRDELERLPPPDEDRRTRRPVRARHATSSRRSRNAAEPTSARRWVGCRSTIIWRSPRRPRRRARSSTGSPRRGST